MRIAPGTSLNAPLPRGKRSKPVAPRSEPAARSANDRISNMNENSAGRNLLRMKLRPRVVGGSPPNISKVQSRSFNR